MENIRLKQTLDNLKLVEKNCSESKKGFTPNVVVCMYLVECLMVTIDIYPYKLLRKLNLVTPFHNKEELLAFLDTTIGRMKRVEHYALNDEEIHAGLEEINSTAYEFLINANFDPQGQLQQFLVELFKRLTEINELMSDPRRSQAKRSYHERMLVGPLIQIASVLEALSVGVANVQARR